MNLRNQSIEELRDELAYREHLERQIDTAIARPLSIEEKAAMFDSLHSKVVRDIEIELSRRIPDRSDLQGKDHWREAAWFAVLGKTMREMSDAARDATNSGIEGTNG